MKHIVALLSLAVGLCSLSCQSEDTRPPTAAEQQRVLNRAKLEGATPATRDAFMDSFPDATINNVEIRPTGAGPLLYRVTFIRNGSPSEIMYNSDGTVFRADVNNR